MNTWLLVLVIFGVYSPVTVQIPAPDEAACEKYAAKMTKDFDRFGYTIKYSCLPQ